MDRDGDMNFYSDKNLLTRKIIASITQRKPPRHLYNSVKKTNWKNHINLVSFVSRSISNVFLKSGFSCSQNSCDS